MSEPDRIHRAVSQKHIEQLGKIFSLLMKCYFRSWLLQWVELNSAKIMSPSQNCKLANILIMPKYGD